jgi:hypothetical protein
MIRRAEPAAEPVEFDFEAGAELSDDALTALAALLIDLSEIETNLANANAGTSQAQGNGNF